jgi:hypothetical protein
MGMGRVPEESSPEADVRLLLAGKRLLVVFHDVIFADSAGDVIDRICADHVHQGRLVSHEERDLWPDAQAIKGRKALGSRLRLYALPDQRWRIEAYLLLTKATRGRPWSDALESFSRLLQGFTEEEIAASIARVHQTHGAWGAFPAYLKVSSADLEKLRQLGFRALPPDLDRGAVLVLASPLAVDELLAWADRTSAAALLRLSIDTKFALTLPFEQAAEGRIVRLSRDAIANLNNYLKDPIEMIRCASS